MSDAFGSDDTTASGGLQSDMPGIGAAPPKPSQVPNALGGLASAFKQMFGGSPPPQPARGPGFGPQGQLTPPPPPQPGPRQTGTTASLALPQGAPQPPAKFTPFIKSQPTRDFSQWGDPEPFPNLPQPFETPSIYRGVGQFFQQNGSQPSIPLAFLLTGHADDYVKGLQEGQEYKSKRAREEMQDAAFKLQTQQEEEHHVYSDVFNEHAALANTTDPKKLDSEALRQDLHNQAIQLGDDKMANLIENGANVAQIMWFQQQRDATLRDLQKTNAKADEQTALDEQWGLKPATQATQSGAPSDWQPGGSAAATGAAAAPSTAGGAAAPASTGGQPAPQPDASGQVAGPGAPSDPQQQPDSPVQEGATEIFKGLEPGTYVPQDVKNAMALRANRMRAQANEILRDPNIKPDQVVAEVQKQLGPTVAADLKGYSQYRSGPGATGQASGGKEQDYWNLLGDLAQKALPGDPANAKPGWNKSTYQAVRDFREGAQKPASPIQRIPTAVGAAKDMLTTLDAIQARDGNANMSPNNFKAMEGKDVLYQRLKLDWLRMNEEVDVVTRGSPSVTMAEAGVQTVPQFPYLGSVAAYRMGVATDMMQLQPRVEELHRTWDQYQTGDPMPGVNPDAETMMKTFSGIDPNTGALPGQTIKTPFD